VHALTVLPGRVDTPMIDNLKVPFVSRKISPDRVARSLLHAVRRGKTEIVVPAIGSGSLILTNVLCPRFANWLVRVFGLEGVQTNKS